MQPFCSEKTVCVASSSTKWMCMHDRISLLNVGTCSLLHLRHLPSTAPRSNVALAAPAEGWRLSWLLLVFQFHIIFRLRAADRFFFQHKGKKENSQNLPTTPSEGASSTPIRHLLHLPPNAPTAPLASHCHLRHLLHLSPTAPAALAPYYTCGTCLLQHLDHMLRLPHQLKAESWADCFLDFCFPISYHFFVFVLLIPSSFSTKAKKKTANTCQQRPQRAHLLHLGHLLHVPPTAPMAPAAPASYYTYGTSYSAYRTCFLLQLRHLPSTPTTLVAPASYWKC